MDKGKSAKKKLIIVAIIAIIASFFLLNSFMTKKNIDSFSSASTGEEISFFKGLWQASGNENQLGTQKENDDLQAIPVQGNMIEIRERMFVGQVNDIYLNADGYLGKTIKLEGIFKKGEDREKDYYFVVRYGPGCCGMDGLVGFEVLWSRGQSYPEDESWVEAIGVLKSSQLNEYLSILYLDLFSLTVLSVRGTEYVRQ